jgi:hypothetical protein
MKWLAIGFVVCISIYLLHRLFLWMESRGWIYYKNRRASPATRANAALEVTSLLEPQKRHVLKIQQEERQEEDGESEPPEPE